MGFLRRGLAGIALILVAFSPAGATSYPSLYVFGDSLVDAGNSRLGTGGEQARPEDGYFNGRYSNGFNFADYVALGVGASIPTPSLAGGTNFAIGGAQAQYKPGEIIPSFLGQIAYLGATVNPSIPSDALVLITFGGNDVRETIGYAGTMDFSAAGADFSKGLSLLYGLGARNFLITGAPDIGLMPDSRVVTGNNTVRLGELSDRSAEISSLFETESAALAVLPGTSVSFFDLGDYEHRLLADPGAFGLPVTLDSSTPCRIPNGGSPQLSNCTNSLYFDYVHPTTIAHEAIGTALLSQIDAVPEPESWELMILGFGTVGIALRHRRSRLASS